MTPFENEKATFEYLTEESEWVSRDVRDVTAWSKENSEEEVGTLIARMSILVGLISRTKAIRESEVAQKQAWLSRLMSQYEFTKSASMTYRTAKVIEDPNNAREYEEHLKKIRRLDASLDALNGLFETIKRSIDACRDNNWSRSQMKITQAKANV